MWPTRKETQTDADSLWPSFRSDWHTFPGRVKLFAFLCMALLRRTPVNGPPQTRALRANRLANTGTKQIDGVQMFAKRIAKKVRPKPVRKETSWPQLVVFDLDYTLWRPELFQLTFPVMPLTPLPNGGVMTSSKEKLDLFPGARQALRELADANVDVAIASRTHLDKLAHQLMKLIRVDERRNMMDCIKAPVIIQSENKVKHFAQIHRKSGVPFKQMLFFDNEMSNIESCNTLGTTCIYCPEGLTDVIFHEGLEAHRRGTPFTYSARREAGSKKQRRRETQKYLRTFDEGSKLVPKKKKRR